jgi:alkanesulfonate monooxygenase SsuD/methylene tetrahydromethanopterin reductase-like flavin-dependent oxidoreductase (luciferase family)
MQVGTVVAIKTLADRFEPLVDVYRTAVEEAVLAEELGFDFWWTSEHHFQADAWSPAQLPILAHVAAKTTRMRLGTNVFLLPLHHPLRVSEDVATVDLLSNGRVDLLCGSGSIAEEFTAMGIPLASRWGRMFEGLEIIRRSYEEDSFTFEGRHFTIPDPIRQTTKPVQQPFPLWVGGGPKTLKRAAKAGYHQQGLGSFDPMYLEGLAESGRNRDDMNMASFVTGHIADTNTEAWEEVKEGLWNWMNEYRKRTWIVWGDNDPPPLPSMDDLPSMNMGVMSPWVGTVDEVGTRLEAFFKNSDTTHFGFAFRGSGGGMPTEIAQRSMNVFAKELMPQMRTWGREPKTSVAAK